jgi:hypothetical protein
MVNEVKFQESQRNCALNSIRNALDLHGVSLSDEDVSKLQDKSLPLCVYLLQRRKAIFQKPKGVHKSLLLNHLLNLRCGIFVVNFGSHCVTFDLNRRVVFDTDPINPRALPLCSKSFDMLQLKTIEIAYQVLKIPKNVNKRKRNESNMFHFANKSTFRDTHKTKSMNLQITRLEV